MILEGIVEKALFYEYMNIQIWKIWSAFMLVRLEVIGCQEVDSLLATCVELLKHASSDVVWFFKAKKKIVFRHDKKSYELIYFWLSFDENKNNMQLFFEAQESLKCLKLCVH